MMMNARFWAYPVYLSPEVARKINAARNLIIFRVVAGLTLAGGCYGGLHLTAWTCQFPSHAETLLWRADSVTITTTGPSVFAFALCKAVAAMIKEKVFLWLLRRRMPRSSCWRFITPRYYEIVMAFDCLAIYVTLTLLCFLGTWYIFCRAFVVVECFIMLAHLPDTTLDIPQWATYIPHIT
jgi:hypothetical protein